VTTKPPKADENIGPDAAQELLEHRDLQNALIDSMMDVWDNPEDEVWNDPDIPGWDVNTSGSTL
jgi:hypothetical protein